MWQLTSPDLTYFNYYANSANNLCVLTPNTSFTGSGLLTSLFQQLTELNVNVSNGSESNTYTFTTTTIPLTIRSNNTIFTLASDYSNPKDGEFIFNNNTVTIFSTTPISTVSYINRSTINTLTVKTIPSFFYNLPAVGGFSITDSWQDHPTANLVFITKPDKLQQYRDTFRTGALVDIYEYSFVVNSYNEEIEKNNYSATVSVSLRGKWEIAINKLIELNGGITSSNNSPFTDPECQVNYEPPVGTSYKSVNSLASRVGARIIGANLIIKIPKDTSDSVSTTLRNELDAIVDINGSFIDYSNKAAIIVKKLDNVRTHYINDSNLLSKFNTSINRLPINVNNTNLFSDININYNNLVPTTITSKPIFSTYENTSLIPKPTLQNAVVPDTFRDNGDSNPEEPTQTPTPRYRLREPRIRSYLKGDLDAAVCPPNIIKLTDLSLNFDKSGLTKTLISVYEEDGLPITEKIYRYGFAYTAKDITYFDGDTPTLLSTSPSSYWQLIEEKVTNYNYDSRTGYLLGSNTKGRRLLRPQVEGDDLYTQQYYLTFELGDETPEPFENAKFNTYSFRWIPLFGAKSYLLAAHRSFYKKFENEEKYYKKCNRDGTSSWELRPDYIEPMFVLGEAEEISCYLSVQDPRNLLREEPEEPYFPDLIVGEESYRRTVIDVLPSLNSPGEIGRPYLDTTGNDSVDRYVSYTSVFSAQEPGYDVVVEETSTNITDGIPPVATRKPPTYELVEDRLEDELPKQDNKQFRYVLFTDPYNGGLPRTGGSSFEKAKNISDVIKGYRNQLTIDDIRNTLTSSCTILLDMSIKSGDKVVLSIEGTTYRRRVVTVQHNFVFEGIDTATKQPLVTGQTQLTMGIDREDIVVNSFREKIPNPNLNNTYNPNSPTGYPIRYNLTLGSLLPSYLPGRGR